MENQALQATMRELDSLLSRTLQDQLNLEALLETLPATVGDLTTCATKLSEAVAALRSLGPQTTAMLASLRTASRPHRLRSAIGALLLMLATLLATLVTISVVWPGWTLAPQARQSLELGTLIHDNFDQLSNQDRTQLEALLRKLAEPSSSTSRPSTLPR